MQAEVFEVRRGHGYRLAAERTGAGRIVVVYRYDDGGWQMVRNPARDDGRWITVAAAVEHVRALLPDTPPTWSL